MALLLSEPPEGHGSAKGQGGTSDLSMLYKTSLGRSWEGIHTGGVRLSLLPRRGSLCSPHGREGCEQVMKLLLCDLHRQGKVSAWRGPKTMRCYLK